MPIGGLPRIKLVACGRSVAVDVDVFLSRSLHHVNVFSFSVSAPFWYRFHSLSVSESGELYSWGQGIDGQLGNGSTLSTRVPSKVGGLKDVVTVSAGVAHSAGDHSG